MSERWPARTPQDRFSAALLDPDLAVPSGLVAPGGRVDERRFAVYRNNVASSLIGALGDIYPTIRRLVGETFFNGMARIFIAESPPRSPLLFDYGRDFATFLDGFEPVADLPYLPDIARLERLWLDAFHAPDVAPFNPAGLGGLAADERARLHLVRHPAAAILRSDFAIVSIFARDRSGQPLDGLDPTQGEVALVTRPQCDVLVSRISPADAIFYQSLFEGRPLGESAGEAQALYPEVDLPAAIGLMLQTGCFAAPDPSE